MFAAVYPDDWGGLRSQIRMRVDETLSEYSKLTVLFEISPSLPVQCADYDFGHPKNGAHRVNMSLLFNACCRACIELEGSSSMVDTCLAYNEAFLSCI